MNAVRPVVVLTLRVKTVEQARDLLFLITDDSGTGPKVEIEIAVGEREPAR